LSRVDDALAKLLHTRLVDDNMFRHYKDLLREKNDLTDKVESTIVEKEELVVESIKVITGLRAQLKESESKQEEFELKASKGRKASKELKEELLEFKKEAMEPHKKGFYKAVRQVGFFTKDLNLGLFDPFKDVKDN